MGEENSSNSNTMNLDLNLGPTDNSSEPPSSGLGAYMNLEDWLDGPPPPVHHRVREFGRHRNHRWRSLWRQLPIPPETRNLALELIGGEGSVASEERPSPEVVKICENGSGYVEEGEGEGVGKKKGDEGSFYDCNICLDLAKDPVVTCCGHLFCWPCLYRWLHHHSDAKECPVCKGEVTTKNVTPIYGRANNNNSSSVREADMDMDMDNPTLKIPIRPPARRVESWRQTIQRSAFSIPMEEMIRRLGSTFDLNRELAQLQSQSRNPDDESSPERSNTLLNRILTSRGMRRERGPSDDHDHVIDLTTESSQRRFSSLLLRRSSNSHRAAENLAVVESYFQSQSNPPPPPPFPFPFLPFDDRDSVSSIAAVIHSESQTMDNAIEIDSTVALSTSSSRRRNNNDASRISDVDSGDSRAPRRRRFN